MEARPFKDASYELKRAVQEAGAQAVPALREAAVQVRRLRSKALLCRVVCRVLCFCCRMPILHAAAVSCITSPCLQATGGRPRPGCSQTSPQQLAAEQAESLLASDGFARFLADALPRWGACNDGAMRQHAQPRLHE